jgi:hypothetical protein
MRARRALGASLLIAAAVVAMVPGPADAATLAQAGWWWRVNDALVPATIPVPLVPEGGLLVAGAPDGATAISALHFDVADGEGAPVLTLAVAENGDVGGEGAVLAACLTGSAWQAESGGAWINKPFPACDQGSVTGVRAADGRSWTFALAPLLSDGIVDVTLVPGTDPALPAGANGSTFQLTFAAPTSASLATSGAGGASPPLDLPDSALPGEGGGPGASFDPPDLGSDLSLPPVAPAAAFTPSLPAADQGLTATAPVVQQRNAPLAATPLEAVEEHRLLAVLILAFCGAAVLWSTQLPTPAPRRLGPWDPDSAAASGRGPLTPTATPGQMAAGLGRFARERSGPAPRL